ncbi:MAG: hypothetical protein FWE20_05800 [Defluviitaleaceae bacterium]|nr:hypothetical protein [Defluviitaleaceae bacterium]
MDMQKYIDRLDQDRRDMELRLREDRQNMEQRLNDDRRASEERSEKAALRLEKHLTQVEQRVENLSKQVRSEGVSTRKWMIGTFIAVVAIAAATIFGILSMVMAVIGLAN